VSPTVELKENPNSSGDQNNLFQSTQSIIQYSALMPHYAVALTGRFQNGMVLAWQGNGMACVNQTRPHFVNQMGKTQPKHLAERRGRGTEWYV
jgi:hypothetical protein